MHDKFCSACGATLEENSKFCSVCGANIGEAAPIAAPAAKVRKPINVKNAVMLGICGILAVTAIVLLCVILFGGKKTPKAFTDYTYSEIVGSYSGKSTVTSYKVSKDFEKYYTLTYGGEDYYEDYIASQKDQLNLGNENRCRVKVNRDGITVRLGEDYSDIHYFSREYLDLDDLGFENGRINETFIVNEFASDERKGVNKVECDLTLKADPRYDYRIVGTLTVIDDLDIYDDNGKHLYDVIRTIVIEIDVTLNEESTGTAGGSTND